MVVRIRKQYIAVLMAVVIAATAMIAAAKKDQAALTVEMPALMYHHITDDARQTGQYVILNSQFESDMQYLAKNGYTAVTVKQLVDFATKGKPLPDKPILVTFDDGYESFYVYAFPVLKKLGINCLFSVIGTYSDIYSKSGDRNVRYAHCTWEQIKEMSQSGVVEIGNHTWSLHTINDRKGCTRKSGESIEQYKSVLTKDISTLQNTLKQSCGFEPEFFTYPFGKNGADSREIIDQMEFKMTLGVEQRVNVLTANNPTCLKLVKRFNRDGRLTTEQFFEKLK